MNRLLNTQSQRTAAANKYAAQLRLLHPDWAWSRCLAQAQHEAHQTNRFWKRTKSGQVVTALPLRAITQGKADMRPKAQDIEVGDLLTTFGNL